ncbi:MAG: hypothetical protein KJS95_00055 [Gammaproteobacteria bacterium]|nr:hypothetical protein [Gammaproteobacteria bacterium]
MTACHAHNLRRPQPALPKPHGLRISLRPGDPFRKLLGADWSRTHWYATVDERDAALAEMSRKHEYSRPGDRPALVYEKVTQLAAQRPNAA